MLKENATFLAFRASGKWYTTGRGVLSEDVFRVFSQQERWHQILRDNGGEYPGLASTGSNFTLVILGDEELDFGWPLMLLDHNGVK